MGFDVELARAMLRSAGARLGEPLSWAAETTSTNDDALTAARAGAPHGACFVAERQTSGRGRRGRRWQSQAGNDLTFSVLLRPRLAPEQASGLSLVAGLAVRTAIARRVGAAVGVKWPNDVYAEGKKLSGVLVESQIQSGALRAVVVGIGVNVASERFDADDALLATSLSILRSNDLQRESLLADILVELERRLAEYEATGLAGSVPELRGVDALLGRPIQVDELRGTASGIDEEGRLLVLDSRGTMHAVLAGTVTVLAALASEQGAG